MVQSLLISVLDRIRLHETQNDSGSILVLGGPRRLCNQNKISLTHLKKHMAPFSTPLPKINHNQEYSNLIILTFRFLKFRYVAYVTEMTHLQ